MKMARIDKRFKELFIYGIWGLLTTVLNFFVYRILLAWAVDYRISNLIALVVTKLAAYFVNKNFVFHTKCASISELCREFLRFVASRGITGLIDYFGLIILVELFSANEIYSKYFISLAVIILNYIFSKKVIFTQGECRDAK